MEENKGQILLYQTSDGESRIEVTLQGETVWLSLDQMAELFQRNKSTISRHIKIPQWVIAIQIVGNPKRDIYYRIRTMTGVNIFISSTCYDLSQVRQDLHDIISGLGYNPMMSEQKSEIID